MVGAKELVVFIVQSALLRLFFVGCLLPFLPLLVGKMQEELVLTVVNARKGEAHDIVHDGELVKLLPLESRHGLNLFVAVESTTTEQSEEIAFDDIHTCECYESL